MAVSSMAFSANTVWVDNTTSSTITVNDNWIGSSSHTDRNTDSETISPGKIFAFGEHADSSAQPHMVYRNDLGYYFTINGIQLPEYGVFEYYAGYDSGENLNHSNLEWGELQGSMNPTYALVVYDGKPISDYQSVNWTSSLSSSSTGRAYQINCSDDTNMTLMIYSISSSQSAITSKSFLKTLL